MTGPTPRVDGGTSFVRPYVLARQVEDQPRANAPRPDDVSPLAAVDDGPSVEVVRVPRPSWAFSPNRAGGGR